MSLLSLFFFLLSSFFFFLSPSPFFSHCLLNIGGQQVPSRSNEQARCRYLSCVGSRNGCCRRCLVLQNITGWSLFFLSLFSFSFSSPPSPTNVQLHKTHSPYFAHTNSFFLFFLLLLFNIQKTFFHTLQQLVPVQCPSVVGFRLHSIDDRLVGRNHSTIESIENSVGGVLLTLRMQ